MRSAVEEEDISFHLTLASFSQHFVLGTNERRRLKQKNKKEGSFSHLLRTYVQALYPLLYHMGK